MLVRVMFLYSLLAIKDVKLVDKIVNFDVTNATCHCSVKVCQVTNCTMIQVDATRLSVDIGANFSYMPPGNVQVRLTSLYVPVLFTDGKFRTFYDQTKELCDLLQGLELDSNIVFNFLEAKQYTNVWDTCPPTAKYYYVKMPYKFSIVSHLIPATRYKIRMRLTIEKELLYSFQANVRIS